MTDFRSNNVLICNLEEDVRKFNKQFQHVVEPQGLNLSLSFSPESVKYDENTYQRGRGNIKEYKVETNEPTRASRFNDNIDQETTLKHQVMSVTDCNNNLYIPNTNSDMYRLNVPYHKQKGNHDLLFEIPNFSSSCSVPLTNGSLNPFNNFTREQRNQF